LSLLFAAAAVAVVSPAYAQTASSPDAKAAPPRGPAAKPSPAKAPAAKTIDTITVTGQSQNGYRSSIDRKSYGITNDLAATTGSISDALKNVPAVEVDVQGNVSLRGDSNVTIMIDGKPSTLFKGPGGAQALQSLPADQFERVEVITNPSAQFSPEGSAGIINLITKQTRRAGYSGSVRANVGTAGRRNFGLGGAYNSNKLTLSGDASWRRDPQHSVEAETRQDIDPIHGDTLNTTSLSTNRGVLEITNLRGGADWDPDQATRVSGELRYNDFRFHPDALTKLAATDQTGALAEQFDFVGNLVSDRENTAGSLNYRRKFDGDNDHVLNANFNREHTHEENDNISNTTFSVPPNTPNLFRAQEGGNGLDQTEFKADYNRPMPHEGRLKTGYYYRLEDNDYDNKGLTGTRPSDAVNDVNQTNHYHYRLQLNAAYATYEQPFGDVTVLGGLRLEDARIDTDQLTTRQEGRQAYTYLYPSLHVADRISDNQQVTLSYSERIARPGPQDLNAFRFVGITTARQGNPDLKPQITHSYELGWQFKDAGTFYIATLYYRQNTRGVTDVVVDIGNNILLTTKANLSQSRNAGLELVANGHLTKALSYNVSANLYWNEIDASHVPLGPLLGFGEKRSAFTQGGRASLNWQATAKDLFQVNVQMNAKRLLPQGYQDPMTLVFLGYRHKFSDALSFVVTVQDPTDSYRQHTVLDTPTLHRNVTDKGRIQAAFFGLTYSFGAARKRPDTFDFGQSPGH
jgi:outer membrane receptor protein involved in Fe transport